MTRSLGGLAASHTVLARMPQGFVTITQQLTPVSAPTELCRLGPGSYFGEVGVLLVREQWVSTHQMLLGLRWRC